MPAAACSRAARRLLYAVRATVFQRWCIAAVAAVVLAHTAFASSATGACVHSAGDRTLSVLACWRVVGMEAPALAPDRTDDSRAPSIPAIPRTIVTANSQWSPHVATRAAMWKALNPAWDFTFFTDAECVAFMRDAYGDAAAAQYAAVRDGPIRGDLFRVHYLYKHGGVWADIDSVPREPVGAWGWGGRVGGVDTATGIGSGASHHHNNPNPAAVIPRSRFAGQLNPTFIIARAGDPTLGAAVEYYARLGVPPTIPGVGALWPFYTYWSWSCVHVLSALRYRGYPVDARAVERCGSNGAAGCVIEDGAGRPLLANRGSDYSADAHRFTTGD